MSAPPELSDLRDCLRPVDYHFGCLLAGYARSDPQAVALAGALASRAVGQGHTLLQLGPVLYLDEAASVSVDTAWLMSALRVEPLVCESVAAESQPATPLVLEGDRLYLNRHWYYETTIARRICSMASRQIEAPPGGVEARFREGLPEQVKLSPEQLCALRIALTRQFAMITGGPGTGKTTIVAHLLNLMAGSPTLQTAVAAPTGKAAARIGEALLQQFEILDAQGRLEPGTRQRMPVRALTLHRLLGARPDRAAFRYHAGNPLPLDLLIVDEASMVDLRLMCALLDALPEHCRLVLLGDHRQLSAVEPGNVFGELCRDAGCLSAARVRELAPFSMPGLKADSRASCLSDAIAVLKHSFRFGSKGGIGLFAQAVNEGNKELALNALAREDDELRMMPYSLADMGEVVDVAVDAYATILQAVAEAVSAERILALRSGFQLLCAPREGEQGVKGLNQAVEQELANRGFLEAGQRYYPGRLILITRNDAGSRLFNGDLGVLMPDPSGSLHAVFQSGSAGMLWVPVSRLPEHQSAYAMTVHKSQGSEFDRVMLVLPRPDQGRASALVSRELVYTGATRARRRLILAFPEGEFADSWLQSAERYSSLAERIQRLG